MTDESQGGEASAKLLAEEAELYRLLTAHEAAAVGESERMSDAEISEWKSRRTTWSRECEGQLGRRSSSLAAQAIGEAFPTAHEALITDAVGVADSTAPLMARLAEANRELMKGLTEPMQEEIQESMRPLTESVAAQMREASKNLISSTGGSASSGSGTLTDGKKGDLHDIAEVLPPNILEPTKTMLIAAEKGAQLRRTWFPESTPDVALIWVAIDPDSGLEGVPEVSAAAVHELELRAKEQQQAHSSMMELSNESQSRLSRASLWLAAAVFVAAVVQIGLAIAEYNGGPQEVVVVTTTSTSLPPATTTLPSTTIQE